MLKQEKAEEVINDLNLILEQYNNDKLRKSLKITIQTMKEHYPKCNLCKFKLYFHCIKGNNPRMKDFGYDCEEFEYES